MAAISEHARPHRRGLFARLVDALIEAREREAERLIRDHLATLDPETLRLWGYDPKTLRWTGEGPQRV